MKLGVTSMAGMGAVGAMAKIPGMPATPVPGIVGTSMNLANVGQLTRVATNVIPKQKRYKR